MADAPWYMQSTDTSAHDKGSPERNRQHIESLAAMASDEADAVSAHLRNAEARGVDIPAESRMAMGFAVNARKAAALLKDN
ncbi:hypothetical protein TPA0910_15600 [Streptomyces hygroscopicus subsp. sporocinereus]|uniref:Uncharacterized protein n=1 Tax=Streptomyces hygroscopicus TaxID=1912 RepID=A0ABQ3TUX6_STRHY|nr:hypothetical protein [Streptomyces hygroscopicus]GHJ27127.1 hypothetical protein TPA0910_15600 [Streptomyces hygroscopicus]